jgi:hypothetical protein
LKQELYLTSDNTGRSNNMCKCKNKELEDRIVLLEQVLRETLLQLRETNNTTHMYMRYDKILKLLDRESVDVKS